MTINESLRFEDLLGVVLPKITVDEFEPKTGEKEDVAVIGFFVTEQSAGDDLANFILKSKFDLRDVEVTPNPDENDHYLVFVEVDRKPGVITKLKELAKDINNVSGDLQWSVKTLLTDQEIPLGDESLINYIKEEPGQYVTKQDFDSEIKNKADESLIEFFKRHSNVTDISIEENVLSLKDYKYTSKFDIVKFGLGKSTLEESGLSELALDDNYDKHIAKILNSMKGSLSVVPINKHFVLHNPVTEQVLVLKPR